MIRLSVMGRLELRNAEAGLITSILAQPKRLALLAYLAVARPEGFRARAEILRLFWPEFDDRRARDSLNTAIAFLRRSLGSDAILTRGDEVGVNLDRLWCDAHAFRQAAAQGRWQEALELYGGDLLPGLATDSLELEHWIDDERRDLLRAATAAANAATNEALQQNNLRAALAAAHRAHELAPFDEGPVRSLLTIHARMGDGAGAVRVYNRFAERLQRELELEPSAQLRNSLPERSAAPPAEPIRPAIVHDVSVAEATATTSAAPTSLAANALTVSATEGTFIQPARSRRAGRLRAAGLVAASLATLLVIAGFSVQVIRQRAAVESYSGPPRTAVLPFTIRGGESVGYLGDGLADILANRLNGVGDARTLDPNVLLSYVDKAPPAAPIEMGKRAARHFAASYFIVGNVTEAGRNLEVNASLYDAAGRLRARANVTTTERDLLSGVEELARELVAGQVRGPSAHLLRAATVTTRSLPALKAYLEGERAYRENRPADMVSAMQRAVAEDSTFALAHYRLAIASEAAGGGGGLERLIHSVKQAVRYRDRLTGRHQMLLDAYHEFWLGSARRAEALYKQSVQRHPEDIEAWHRLAELQFHRMPSQGKPFTDARHAFERVLAIDSTNASAVAHLARIAAAQGRLQDLDDLLARLGGNGQPGPDFDLQTLRAFANHDAGGQAQAIAAAKLAALDVTHVAASRVASYTANMRGAESLAALLIEPANPLAFRVVGHLQLAEFEAAAGRWQDARRRLQQLAPLAPALALTMEASLAILPIAPAPRDYLVDLRRRVADWNTASTGLDSVPGVHRVPPHTRSVLRRFHLGALSLRLGDVAAAAAQSNQLDRDAVAAELGLNRVLRARIAQHNRQFTQALAALDSLPDDANSMAFVRQEPLTRFMRGQLLEAAGRPGEADGWYGSFGDLAQWDMALLAPGALARARFAQQRGDHAAAAHFYGRVLKFWENADPEVQPLVAHARSQIAQLKGR